MHQLVLTSFLQPMILLLVMNALTTAAIGGGASTYDYTGYIECSVRPGAVLYEGGGMISDPDFEVGEDLMGGWSPFAGCELQLRHQSSSLPEDIYRSSTKVHLSGNTFLATVNRTNSFSGPSILLPEATTSTTYYALSAWVQVSHHSLQQPQSDGPPLTQPQQQETVKAIVKASVVVEFQHNEDNVVLGQPLDLLRPPTVKKYVSAGTVVAQSGCWSFLKGGFTLDHIVNDSSFAAYSTWTARLYFETVDFTHGLELWLDNIALKSFSDEEWLSHQATSMETLRRRTINLQVMDEESNNGLRAHDAKLSRVEVVDASFKFGAAIDEYILEDTRYQRWFMERFNMAVLENEMKWYATEKERGKVEYNVSDAMVKLCEENGVGVRGHSIVWEDPTYQPAWLKKKELLLVVDEVRQAVSDRVASLVEHYAGRLLHWDVSNELFHFSFIEDSTADPQASLHLFQQTQSIDPSALLFLNDYNTLENPDDLRATPDAYIAKLQQFRAAGITNLAIGLESHFSLFPPNLPYMRAALDKLAATGFPVWLTELDVDLRAVPNANMSLAATYLESILDEAMSHPGVSGILVWAAWHPTGRCYRMCLTDADMLNLPLGDVVDKALHKWRRVDVHLQQQHVTTTSNVFSWRGPVGTHRVTLHSGNTTHSTTFVVNPGTGAQHIPFLIDSRPPRPT